MAKHLSFQIANYGINMKIKFRSVFSRNLSHKNVILLVDKVEMDETVPRGIK